MRSSGLPCQLLWGVRLSRQLEDRLDRDSRPEIGPEEKPKPNLDEERLAILRMVEQGKISSAEAEKLLDALE